MKRARWISAVLVCMLLLFSVVSSVQAGPTASEETGAFIHPEPAPPHTVREFDPSQFNASWGISPDMLINCDPINTLLTELNPGSAQTFHKLQAGACKTQFTIDAFESTAEMAQSFSPSRNKGYSGLSGESNMIKIYPVTTEVQYVYLQCGKKVATFGPPTCTCGANWRYTYSCAKPKTVYITLPCR